MVFDTVTKFGRPKKEEIPEEEMVVNQEEILFTLIKNRRSVRQYEKRDVGFDLIEKVLESTRYAPSAGNYQPWEFIVVKDESLRRDLVEAAYNQDWMMQAPVFIIACVNNRLAGAYYGDRGTMLYGIQSVAVAIQNMLLTAESLGLGTCWIGSFSETMVSRILQCPEYCRPCAIITLGYPAEKPFVPARQEIQEYVHLEKFGETLQLEEVKKEKKPTYMKFR